MKHIDASIIYGQNIELCNVKTVHIVKYKGSM
jgi:hypothetical protein